MEVLVAAALEKILLLALEELAIHQAPPHHKEAMEALE
jgi:hypothetical protein